MPDSHPAGFRDGVIQGVVLKELLPHDDARGWLTEIYRQDELFPEHCPVMAYLSETLPGAARGPHEHADQTDYFAFLGPGEFLLYLWDVREGSASRGVRMKIAAGQSNRRAVLVPPGVVHAYKNVGAVPGWVINTPNRLYAGPGRKGPLDEIRHENDPHSPFVLD